MNKQQLIAQVSTQVQLSKKVTQQVLESIVDTIVTTILSGDTVNLTGLGTFGVSETNARDGRNPKTGEALHIPASLKPVFKFTAPVKRAVKESATVDSIPQESV
jgi:DNA-binding protein HU-beta